jgi:hypothetical protein
MNPDDLDRGSFDPIEQHIGGAGNDELAHAFQPTGSSLFWPRRQAGSSLTQTGYQAVGGIRIFVGQITDNSGQAIKGRPHPSYGTLSRISHALAS